MIHSQVTSERQSKYCIGIEKILRKLGHATNSELLIELRNLYPELSATTVHRASARLAGRGKIAIAPADKDGSVRYDYNLVLHDHFLCTNCSKLMDTDVKDSILPIMKQALSGCDIAGRITISGVCKVCTKGRKE